MAFNYDEAIMELRQEEKRLMAELEQVRAAIPALIILRNRNKADAVNPEAAMSKPRLPGIGRFAGVGATQAIPELLKGAEIAMTAREVYEGLVADGWSSDAKRPAGAVSATLLQLFEKGIVERIGEGWRIKRNLERLKLNVPFFPSIGQQQLSSR